MAAWRKCGVKRGLNLPSDWVYVDVVLPALKLGQPLAHVMNASLLIERGLHILQIATSSQARAGISGIKLKSKTGLIVPVTEITKGNPMFRAFQNLEMVPILR